MQRDASLAPETIINVQIVIDRPKEKSRFAADRSFPRKKSFSATFSEEAGIWFRKQTQLKISFLRLSRIRARLGLTEWRQQKLGIALNRFQKFSRLLITQSRLR